MDGKQYVIVERHGGFAVVQFDLRNPSSLSTVYSGSTFEECLRLARSFSGAKLAIPLIEVLNV